MEATRSDGMTSSFTLRTPPSGDGTFTPLMVTLLSRGSVPRICTYFPSPSSRSRETLGSRPTASAMFVFGRLVMTSAGSTCTMLSAVRSRLSALTVTSSIPAQPDTPRLWPARMYALPPRTDRAGFEQSSDVYSDVYNDAREVLQFKKRVWCPQREDPGRRLRPQGRSGPAT